MIIGGVIECAVVCPSASDYSPCACKESAREAGLIAISCPRLNLDDSTASKILDSFVNTAGVSPVGFVDFTTNQLTRIPTQIRMFAQLLGGTFEDNNISSIDYGAFDFRSPTAVMQTLVLAYNNLKTIAPGAFQGIN